MQVQRLTKTAILTLISILVVLLLASAATFAWFTVNQRVQTSTATGTSGSTDVKLLLGSSEADLQEDGDIDINPVNDFDTGSDRLSPVSTANLETFVTCVGTMADSTAGDKVTKAVSFQPVYDENKYYYHGELYMRPDGVNIDENAKMKIYFDVSESSGGPFGNANEKEGFLNAARLGLRFEEEEPKIFYFDDTEISRQNTSHTILNADEKGEGQQIGDKQVIDYSGSYTAVDDPAVLYSEYAISRDDSSIELPEEAIAELDINKTYKVDVYYYLEGCDPDCVDDIQTSSADLHLSFYGVLE